MRLPFVSRRRVRAHVALATAALRSQLADARAEAASERSARLAAEARAAQLDQRLYEMQLATELHDQQLHAPKEDDQ